MPIPLSYRFILCILTRYRQLAGPTAAVAFMLLPLLALAGGPGWQPGFNTPGLNGRVHRVVQWRGNSFIAAGDFTDAGGQPAANHVARWNGRRWRPLGAGPGFNGPKSYLVDLLALPNGDLVAAGGWDDSATAPAFVTRWDGRRWQRLGPAFAFAELRALAVTPGGELLLGLNSTDRAIPSGLQRWNGTAWQPLEPAPAPGGPVSSIYHMVVTPTGDVLAVGSLRGADGAVFRGAGRWMGTAWQQLGTDFPQPQELRLLLAPDGAVLLSQPRPNEYQPPPGRLHGPLLRWDGAAWLPFDPRPAGQPWGLGRSANGELLAYGRFVRPGDTLSRACARYDGRNWQVLSLPRREWGPGLEIVAISARGELLVNTPRHGLRRWDGRRWRELEGPRQGGIAGPESYVQTMASAPGSHVLVASIWDEAAPIDQRYRVIRWQGRRHEELPLEPGWEVSSLVVLPGGDAVGIGKCMLPTTERNKTRLFRWHGRHRRDMSPPPDQPNALLVTPDGRLLAAGSFGVARWDGATWQVLGDLLHTEGFRARVEVLAVAPNGDILTGGPRPGAPANPVLGSSVARWNGQRWEVLGTGLRFRLRALLVRPDGEVLAAGSIRYSGHFQPAFGGRLARWNGEEWQTLGPELDGAVNTLGLTPNGDVVVGGAFKDAGDNPRADYLARWDGRAWYPLGAGPNGAVQTLIIGPDGAIRIGGDFTATSDEALPMWHLGIYRAQ